MPNHKDARFWDRIAPKYARHTIKDMAGYERSLQRSAELIAGCDVLELGCGTGQTALRLAPAARQYLATDFAARMIALGQQRLAETPVTNLSFQQVTAENLAEQNQTFDVILGFNFLHLVRDLPATLTAIRHLLRDGGLLVTKTVCLHEMNPLIRLAVPVMRAVGLAPHVSTLSGAALEQALTAQGFEILSVERHGTSGRDVRPFIVARKA